MYSRTQELALLLIIGLLAAVMLVGVHFGLKIGFWAILAALLLLYVCGKVLL